MGWGGLPVAGSRRQGEGSLRPQDPGIQKLGLLTWAQRTCGQDEALVLRLDFPMMVMREPSPVLPGVRSHSLSPGLTQPRDHSSGNAITLCGCQARGHAAKVLGEA